jgi:hypothetical protein
MSALNTVGFRFYDSGIVKDKNNKKIGDYVKGDVITHEQKVKLHELLGDRVHFMIAQSQYAPEQIKPIVMFKVKAKKSTVHVINS